MKACRYLGPGHSESVKEPVEEMSEEWNAVLK